MKFLLFSDLAETQFCVRKMVNPAEDLLVTVKDEWLFFRLIQLTDFELFLIDLNSGCRFSDLRLKMCECKLKTPWILLSTQSNLSFQNYIGYWKALNGITSYSDDSYNEKIEAKLKKLAISLRKTDNLEISKNAKKLLDFFVEFQNKSISIETLQEKVFGEASPKNRNLLYGLIHEIRKSIGDDLSHPKDLIRFKKGRYKLVNAFPEKCLDVCVYGSPAQSEYAQYEMFAEKAHLFV
ncbi:MAG: hypothetical protein PUF61_06185 [Spirochaetales bacterium]|nr:hypothetical protein [Spirochaetales bacterium]